MNPAAWTAASPSAAWASSSSFCGGAGRPRLADELEAHAVDELHDEEMLALVRVAILERPHDVGMHQLDGDLPLERARLLGRGPRRGRLVLLAQLDLQADRPARLVIDRPIDPRHAAARRLRDDREPALEIHATPVHAAAASMARDRTFLSACRASRHSPRAHDGRRDDSVCRAIRSISRSIRSVESRAFADSRPQRGASKARNPREARPTPTNRSGGASLPQPAPEL